MNRILIVALVGIVCTACVRSPAATGEASNGPRVAGSIAVAVESRLQRLAWADGAKEPLWPGFDPVAVPLAIFDGERTFLFRHPEPPAGFKPLPDTVSDAHVFDGRHEAVTANTSAELGGVSTATLLLDGPPQGSSVERSAEIAVHEAFHVFQRARHPDWAGNEADLFTYPTDDAQLLSLRRLETEGLRRALASEAIDDSACWARTALAMRQERYAQMDSAFSTYERATELNEGLATYVEMQAAGRRILDWPAAGFDAAEVRRRAYTTGSALALLLDRFSPGWPAKFGAVGSQALDSELGTALGPGQACAFAESFTSETEDRARADTVALTADRTRRLSDFLARPGWHVVIVVEGGEPLWPQGFDPLNVELVDATRVLHTRFLRLGNANGELQVLNAESSTEGAGAHPLYQGIRRVQVAGLPEPQVSEVDGRVAVRATGLDLEFTHASLAVSGQLVTIGLGSPSN